MRRPLFACLILLSALSAIGCRPRPVPPTVTPPQAEVPADPAAPAKPADPAPTKP